MKSTLLTVLSFLILANLNVLQGQCDNPPGDITINSAGGNGNATYTTQYVLVDNASGNISQISGTTTFTAVALGSYTIYAVNYKTSAGITGLTVGSPWASVTSTCFDVSTGLPIGVGVINDLAVSDVTVCDTETADQTITITNADPNVTYEIQPDGGGAGIASATNGGSVADLDITFPGGSLPASTTTYQIVASLSGCSDVTMTDKPVITVNPSPVVTTQPTAQSVCEGDDATFTVVATGTGLTYQWYTDASGSFAAITGATSASYTLTGAAAGNDGDQFYVEITSGASCLTTSSTVGLTVNPSPVVTTQPTAQSVCEGDDATFTVVASGTGLTYQWYTDASGSFAAITGATSASYTLTGAAAGNDGDQFYVEITSGASCLTTSSTVGLTVNPSPVVTTQPTAQSVCEGDDATFTVVATGTGLTYQWYTDASGSFAAITGATSASYTLTGAAAGNDGDQFYVEITSGASCLTTSSTVGLTVNTSPVVTTQPTAQSVCEGDDATFTVVATGTGLTYQWYTDASGSFAAITGATSASYTLTGAAAGNDGDQFYVEITSGASCLTTSSTVGLTVNPSPVVTTQPTAQSVCEGDDATFTVVATGTGLTYQWYTDASGSFAAITGATSASYTLTGAAAGNDGDQFYVEITSGASCLTTSSTVGLTVNPSPVVTTQPTAQSVCEGDDATFTVVATGTGLTYQWYTDASGSFAAITGATSASYTLTGAAAGNDGDQFYVEITSGASCLTTSSTVGLTVNPSPVVTTQPTAQSVCEGDDATFTVVATGTGLTYQWYTDASGSFAAITGATSASYTLTGAAAANDGDQFYVEITSGASCLTTSSTVGLTVNPSPVVTTQPTAQSVCEGDDATFTVVATGTGLTYQWYTDASGSFAAITGATSASYTLTGAAAGNDGDQFYVEITSGASCLTTSSTVSLTVEPGPQANAGANSSQCDDLAVFDFAVIKGDITSANGTIKWTADNGSGTPGDEGTFDNDTLLNPKYTASATDIAQGTVTFTLTVTGTTGSCTGIQATSMFTLTLTDCCNAAAPTISK